MSTESADYLDTQTLAGAEGYFHTENAPTHATDGTAVNPEGDTGETPLVAASRGDTAARVATPEDGSLEALTNGALIERLKAEGKAVPRGYNKAKLIAALRAE